MQIKLRRASLAEPSERISAATRLIANIFRPGTDPLAGLAHALTETFLIKDVDATQVETDLLRSSAALDNFIAILRV